MEIEFKCPACNVIFEASEKLAAHLRKCYPRPQKLPCIKCEKSFRDAHNWRRHWTKHVQEKQFQCQDCKSKLATAWSLYSHQKTICNGNYSCNKCDYVGKHGKDMTQHNKIHKIQNPSICPICDKVFTRLDQLHEHIGKFHSKDWEKDSKKLKNLKSINAANARKCPSCERIIFTNYLKHEKFCNGGLKCPICKETFYYQSRLIVHVETHQTDKTFSCKFCDQRFGTADALLLHMGNVHKVKKENQASESIADVDTSNNLQKHQKEPLNHQTCNLLCSKCGRFFSTFQILRHERVCIGSLTCNKCSIAFTQLCSFRAHMESIHKENRKYCCKVCKRRFFSFLTLLGHLKKQHKMQNSEANSPTYCQIDNGPEAMRKCPKCSRVFRVHGYFNSVWVKHLKVCKIMSCWICKKIIKGPPYQLNLHIKRLHLKEKIHKCKDCGQTFWASIRLEAHRMLYHSKIKSGKSFSVQIHSNREAKQRSSRYDLTCKRCGRIFVANGNRKRHEMTCTGELKCKECNKTFSTRQRFNDHLIRKHNKETPFKCSLCTRSFVSNNELILHTNSHHLKLSTSNNAKQLTRAKGRNKPKTVPPKPNLENRVYLANAFFPCPYCPFTAHFSTKTGKHVVSKHPLEASHHKQVISTFTALNGPQKFSKTKTIHICYICGNKFYNECLARFHSRQGCKCY